LVLGRLIALLLVFSLPAWAQRDSTRGALSRLEETIAARVADGALTIKDLTPAIVVSTQPAFESTRAWYPSAAIATLARALGAAGLRACEACMAPRLSVQDGRFEQLTTALTVQDVVRLDEATRGAAAPARVGIWLDETPEGVAVRVVDLRNGRIIWADALDAQLRGVAAERKSVSLMQEYERRIAGRPLVHTFVDVGVLPAQHISVDFYEQWGDDNANLSGFTISAFDPVLGVGGGYFRVIPQALNLTIGAKLLVSVPTAFINALSMGNTTGGIDPLLTGVLVVRFPLFTTNFAVVGTLSTNGRVTFGISLLNVSLLPFLP
jgi:hypothetical protein